MGLSSVLIISLAAGVVLVVGGGLMMYMANLVRSAYEIKVQINSDVDERLNKMAEDLDKKSRWIKRDLLEELDKIRVSLAAENATKFQGLVEPLLKRIEDLEQMLRNERTEWVKAVESDRQNITALDTRLKTLRRDVKKIEDHLGIVGGSGAALDEATAILAAKSANQDKAPSNSANPFSAANTPPPAAAAAPAATQPAPPAPPAPAPAAPPQTARMVLAEFPKA